MLGTLSPSRLRSVVARFMKEVCETGSHAKVSRIKSESPAARQEILQLCRGMRHVRIPVTTSSEARPKPAKTVYSPPESSSCHGMHVMFDFAFVIPVSVNSEACPQPVKTVMHYPMPGRAMACASCAGLQARFVLLRKIIATRCKS